MPEKQSNGIMVKINLAGIAIILSLVANLLIVGAGYGGLSTKVDNLSQRVVRLEATIDSLRTSLGPPQGAR